MPESVNPATGEVLQRYEEHGPPELEARLARAGRAFASYRRTAPEERAGWLARAAELLEAEAERLGRLATLEMGKPLAQAVGEVRKSASGCRYYAEHGPRFLADEPVEAGERRCAVRHLPLGPMLAVMPWNFPYWQVVRFAAPALMAGNVALLKHASSVPGCALALEELFLRAGFPEGVFQALLVPSSAVASLVADSRVRAVSLTGSEAAGVKVGEAAGRALKKVVLELGGSDPFIVMPSADLDAAIATGIAARCQNNGQSCIAAKRFIVHEEVYEAFERSMAKGLRLLQVGDPLDERTDVGPLASRDGLETLEAQVDGSVKAGARVVTGGRRLHRPGFYYQPTALADIPRAAPVYEEEVFGPVALLFRVRSAQEAVELANASRYGLGSSVWTRDPAEQELFANELEAGSTFVNAMVASDPRLPFGGVKRSGHGRELGPWGLRELVNLKTVVFA